MRLLQTAWKKVTNVFTNSKIGQELEGMSQWLDSHPEILEWVSTEAQIIGYFGVQSCKL